jgi:hypothetical protein
VKCLTFWAENINHRCLGAKCRRFQAKSYCEARKTEGLSASEREELRSRQRDPFSPRVFK